VGLDGPEWDDQGDQANWPVRKEELAAIFKARTRAQWCELLELTDVCFAPVLSMAEAPQHPHNVARGTFVEAEGIVQPGPAPRFSRTVPALDRPPSRPGRHTEEVLAERGFSTEEIDGLRDAGAVR
jgi:alpha-methylacyl-CoA racemase